MHHMRVNAADLWEEAGRPSEQVRGLTDGTKPEHEHEHTGEPHAEPAMRWHAVAEEVEVEREPFGLMHFSRAWSPEHVNAVLALRSCRDFDAVVNEVVAFVGASVALADA